MCARSDSGCHRGIAEMRMLDNLKEVLDDIELSNEWEAKFLSGLIIKQEEGKLERLSDKQFKCLTRIHEKYCGTGRP